MVLRSTLPNEVRWARKRGAARRGANAAAVAAADARDEGKGAELRGAKRGEAGATQRGSRKAAEVAKAEAEAGGRGSGAGQRGAKQSGASAEQRGGAKAAKDAEAVADA